MTRIQSCCIVNSISIDHRNTIGRLIGVAHHRFQKVLDTELSAAGVPITADQFKMMNQLWEIDGQSQQTFATKLGRNRSATGRMIDVLERKGLVRRGPHPTDRRLNLIFLTAEGKAIQKKASQCAQKALRIGLQNIDKDSIAAMKKLLKQIIHNLE